MDLLASEYGWSKRDILEDVYIDELFRLTTQINIRKINQYRIDLAIATNPHIKKPEELVKILNEQERQLTGPAGEELDVVGLEALKQKLRHNPRFIVKK